MLRVLLVAQRSEIPPGRFEDARCQTWIGHMQGKCPNPCAITPVPKCHFFKSSNLSKYNYNQHQFFPCKIYVHLTSGTNIILHDSGVECLLSTARM